MDEWTILGLAVMAIAVRMDSQTERQINGRWLGRR